MPVFTERCRLCKGTGRLEYFEEREISGDGWRRRKRDETPLELLEAMARECPSLVRVVEDDCEVCAGRGEYELESVPCKIF